MMDVKIKTGPSPFKIEGLFFPEVKFQAFPQKKRKKREVPSLKDIKLFFSPIDEENRFQASVKIISEQDVKSERFCYGFSLIAVGIFKWDEKIPSEEKEAKLFEGRLAVTGASILYSGLRTMLQNITAMGPYPLYILPPVCFTPEMVERVEKIESAPIERNDTIAKK